MLYQPLLVLRYFGGDDGEEAISSCGAPLSTSLGILHQSQHGHASQMLQKQPHCGMQCSGIENVNSMLFEGFSFRNLDNLKELNLALAREHDGAGICLPTFHQFVPLTSSVCSVTIPKGAQCKMTTAAMHESLEDCDDLLIGFS